MKTPTDNLFQLIRSMTAAEKRYFKRHYSTKKSHATLLFDVINKQKIYNEPRIKQQFENTNLAKNLKVHKAQLEGLLIKSLCSYHNKRLVKSKIRMGLEEVEILLNMQLFDMAHNRLNNIKKLCNKYQTYDYIYAILILDVHFSVFYTADNTDNDEISPFKELVGYTNKLHFLFQHLDTNNNVFSLTRLINELNDEHRQLYEHFLTKLLDRTPKNIEELYQQLLQSQLLVLLQQDIRKAYELIKHSLEYFEKNIFFEEGHPLIYWYCQFNHLQCCIALNKEEEYKASFKNLEHWIKKQTQFEAKKLQLIHLSLKAHFQRKQFSLINTRMEKRLETFEDESQEVISFTSIVCYYYLALANLIEKNNSKIEKYLSLIKKNKRLIPSSYSFQVNIAELVIYYDLSDVKRFKNALRQFIKKQINTSKYEDFHLFFTKIASISVEKDTAHFTQFKNNYEKRKTLSPFHLFDIDFFEDWLIARSQKKSLADYFKDTHL